MYEAERAAEERMHRARSGHRKVVHRLQKRLLDEKVAKRMDQISNKAGESIRAREERLRRVKERQIAVRERHALRQKRVAAGGLASIPHPAGLGMSGDRSSKGMALQRSRSRRAVAGRSGTGSAGGDRSSDWEAGSGGWASEDGSLAFDGEGGLFGDARDFDTSFSKTRWFETLVNQSAMSPVVRRGVERAQERVFRWQRAREVRVSVLVAVCGCP